MTSGVFRLDPIKVKRLLRRRRSKRSASGGVARSGNIRKRPTRLSDDAVVSSHMHDGTADDGTTDDGSDGDGSASQS